MKICVLTHTFPRDAKDSTAAFMKEFCDGLVQAGNEVILLTPYDSKFNRRRDLFKIVTYKYIWPSKFHLLGYSRTMEADVNIKKVNYLLVPFMIFFGVLSLLKVVYKEKVDLINAHWILPNGLIAYIVSIITRVPFIVTLPGTDTYIASRFRALGLLARMIGKSSAGIVSNSSWNLNKIIGLGIKGKMTSVIPYPVDFSKLQPSTAKRYELQRKYGLTDSNFVALAVGRLVYKKGYDYLIKAITLLSERYPNIRLIIGGEGDLGNKWKKLAQSLKISDKVIFVGTISRDQISYYYNLADVMVSPSIIDKYGNVDGGPVVSFESMACGKPQITTFVLGVSDIIKNGVNGYIVSEKNEKQIAQALEKMIMNKKLRLKMGQANRRLVVSSLGTQSIGKKYTSFFKKVLVNI